MKKITKCVLSALMMVSILSGIAYAKPVVFQPKHGAETRIDRHRGWERQQQKDKERQQRRKIVEERERRQREMERERQERERARMKRHHHMNHFLMSPDKMNHIHR
jgi:hypothetical protein